jgi:ATP-dependent exoDNAse (exonuclease V) alpha subunit
MDVRPISRSQGRTVVGAAAYRSGERLRDERRGRLHNHSHRTDIPHKEILLPRGVDASRIPWVQKRSELWNAAERAEIRRDARVGREFLISLPHELEPDRRRDLARAFSQELADRFRVVVDLAVHLPRPGGDPHNHHAHLLLTTREVTEAGFGGKTGLDLSGTERMRRGLLAGIHEIKAVRERFATLTNEALQSAGLDVRVDHRSLQEQGIDRLPGPRFPYHEILKERRGLRSEIAERIRANHLERVQARHMRSIAQESPPLTSGIDEVRKQAVQAWLKVRADAVKAQERGAGHDKSVGESAARTSPDDDLGL